MRHLLSLKDLTKEEILKLIERAEDIKKNPENYRDVLDKKTLLMIFAKPSLRTRLSFETGMTQMGGHAIYYDISTSPMGKKESISDTAKTFSRYVDIVMARLFDHKDVIELANNSGVPVINALTDFSHPCQILSDLLTIKEKKGLKKIKLAYVGDCNNNVTHSLLFGCTIMGIDINVASPKGKEYEPDGEVVRISSSFANKNGSIIDVLNDAKKAVSNADIIYTDSWMSYHIPKEKENERVRMFEQFQVNSELMKHAKSDAIFMNCLPALRGYEQTADVIDGPQSVVFDQAENRLHMQKAIMLWLLDK
jgi:ornithine carbamoyltransferase